MTRLGQHRGISQTIDLRINNAALLPDAAPNCRRACEHPFKIDTPTRQNLSTLIMFYLLLDFYDTIALSCPCKLESPNFTLFPYAGKILERHPCVCVYSLSPPIKNNLLKGPLAFRYAELKWPLASFRFFFLPFFLFVNAIRLLNSPRKRGFHPRWKRSLL